MKHGAMKHVGFNKPSGKGMSISEYDKKMVANGYTISKIGGCKVYNKTNTESHVV